MVVLRTDMTQLILLGTECCSAASVYTAQHPTYHVIIAAVGNSYQARGTREISLPLRVGPVVGLVTFEG